MKRIAFIAIAILSILPAMATETHFSSPVHIPIALAGNFGEPRPNHFHGGIDVKTEMREGLGIYSIGGGYVSRIVVNHVGAGRCVYIRHPEGYTSIYFHLRSFSPQIRNYVERVTGKKLTQGHQPRLDEECDIDVPKGLLMVAQGDFIARSGDSGSSEGPHLHLEIHDTKTNDMLDPLDFLGQYVQDNKQPQGLSLMAYPQEGHGIFQNSQNKQSFGLSGTGIERKLTAWGKVGFGLWASDFSEVTYNHLGIRHRWLICDGDTVSYTNLNDVPLQMNREINAWGDYEHYTRTHNWYLKGFREQGVNLPFIYTSSKYPRGIINFNEQREYHLKYVLADFRGNKIEYSWTVQGTPGTIRSAQSSPLLRLARCDRQYWWQSQNAAICIPPRNLGKDVLLSPRSISAATGNQLTDTWSFYDRSMPLYRKSRIYLRLKRKPSEDMEIVVTSNLAPGKTFPAHIEGDWAVAEVRDLGAHYHIIESPPKRPND